MRVWPQNTGVDPEVYTNGEGVVSIQKILRKANKHLKKKLNCFLVSFFFLKWAHIWCCILNVCYLGFMEGGGGMDLLCPLNPPAGEHDIITAFDQILDGPQQNDFPLL